MGTGFFEKGRIKEAGLSNNGNNEIYEPNKKFFIRKRVTYIKKKLLKSQSQRKGKNNKKEKNNNFFLVIKKKKKTKKKIKTIRIIGCNIRTFNETSQEYVKIFLKERDVGILLLNKCYFNEKYQFSYANYNKMFTANKEISIIYKKELQVDKINIVIK